MVARAGHKTITPTDLHRKKNPKENFFFFFLFASIREHTCIYNKVFFLVFFDDSRCFLKKTPSRTDFGRKRERVIDAAYRRERERAVTKATRIKKKKRDDDEGVDIT